MLFIDNIFENFHWNCYRQKRQAWKMSMENFKNIGVFYTAENF